VDKRKKRHEEFSVKRTGWYSSLWEKLLFCSHTLLLQSLAERHRKVARIPDNHYSHNAVGSIILLVDGLEAWLNKSIWYLSDRVEDTENFFKLANTGIKQKYHAVPKQVAGTVIPTQPNFEMVLDVRHEISHFLPRIIEEEPAPARHVPSWLSPLFEQRIFFIPYEREIPDDVDLTLSTLLCSYKLAYWSWQIVEEAVETYCEALKDDPVAGMISKDNFDLYKSTCHPDNLPAYDKEHGLTTKFFSSDPH
jgi:hypothetical protein